MEQKHTCASICDQLPTQYANHPWLVDQNLEDDNRDHILYTTRDPTARYRCRIPSFLGKRIRGCSYGWVILSNHPRNDEWSLWNPMTSNIIRLPRLISKYEDQGLSVLHQCCLSSSPDDLGSIFMLTIDNYAVVYCRLGRKRKRLKWVEMSYGKQMRGLTGGFDRYLLCLTCCNGRVYAFNDASGYRFVIHVDIVVKGLEIVIRLLPYVKVPSWYIYGCLTSIAVLKGCCTELFYIQLGFDKRDNVDKQTLRGVLVCKLDMINKRWEQMVGLKDAAIFLDLAHGYSVFYSPAMAASSELGGYVHFLDKCGTVTHSFDFKDKTITFSSMPAYVPSKSCVSLSEYQSQGERGKNEENTESCLPYIPFDVLKTIMKFCVGVEYLNFRATCKQCHLEAPMIRWSKEGRLQTYSLASPWLMSLDKHRGVITFSDPLFGNKYFMRTPRELIGDVEIHCSMGGWILLRKHMGPLTFFNPFTSDMRELPFAPCLETYCFSAPPTDPDCMVVGFTTHSKENVFILFAAREPFWRSFQLNFRGDSHTFRFATIYRQNLYALYDNGAFGFINTSKLKYNGNVGRGYIYRYLNYIGNVEFGPKDRNLDYTWREGPRRCCVIPKQSFLMKCDQQLLLVNVGEFGECVEVFKMNDLTRWEKIESLGRHAVYICPTTCLCVEAKTPEMANKIYFPRFHLGNMKMVFYSLETKRYHTFNMEESFGDFMGTKHHVEPHVWIEPSWS